MRSGKPLAQSLRMKTIRQKHFIWLHVFSRTELGKIVLPATIGALFACLAFLGQYFFITKPSETRANRRAILEQKLTRIYAPLSLYLTAGGYTLTPALKNEAVFQNMMNNYHLLSPQLQKILSDYLSLYRGGFREPDVPISNMPKLISLSEQFNEQLKREMTDLSKQYFSD